MRYKGRMKKTNDPDAVKITAKVVAFLETCGLTEKQIFEFSGLDRKTVSRIMKQYNKAPNLNTLAPLVRVAGYRLELVPLDPRVDKFRSSRLFPPPPIVLEK